MAESGRAGRHHLAGLARRLPDAWTSSVLARIGTARLKLLRMDAAPYAQEVHDYPEGLLVVEGRLRLRLGQEAVTLEAGELQVVPAGVPHAVEPGSEGTLLIIDT